MLKKITVGVLFLITACSMMLTFKRASMNYNSEGKAFDGETVYSTNAIVAYTSV